MRKEPTWVRGMTAEVKALLVLMALLGIGLLIAGGLASYIAATNGLWRDRGMWYVAIFLLSGGAMLMLLPLAGLVFNIACWIAISIARRGDKDAIPCDECGYDLRYSTDRCPECGRTMTGWQQAMASWSTGRHLKPGQQKNNSPRRAGRI